MSSKKRKTLSWWRKPRTLRRLAILVFSLFLVGGGAWYVLVAGSSSAPKQFLQEPAPAFSLPTTDSGSVASSDYLGKHNLLLFFNEGIGCAPCFDQIVDLEADWARFKALDLELVSIMVDPLDELAREAKDRSITGIVASDPDKKVSESYEAMQASMHPGVKPGHTFVLVNKRGKIIWRWDWSGHGKPMYYEVDEIYKQVAEWLGKAG